MSIGDFSNDCGSKPAKGFVIIVWILHETFDQGACFLPLNMIVGKAFLLAEESLEDFTVLD